MNYDPRDEKEYCRISGLEIIVQHSMLHAQVTVFHEMAKVVDGVVTRVENQAPITPLVFSVKTNDTTQYPFFNANTGEDVAQTTCDASVLAGLVAAIHQRRKPVL